MVRSCSRSVHSTLWSCSILPMAKTEGESYSASPFCFGCIAFLPMPAVRRLQRIRVWSGFAYDFAALGHVLRLEHSHPEVSELRTQGLKHSFSCCLAGVNPLGFGLIFMALL